jgi:hypothetical protein
MPRSYIDKLAQGTRRVIPDLHWYINSTPAANSFSHSFQTSVRPTPGSYSGSALARRQVTGGTSPSLTGGLIVTTDPTAPNQLYLTKGTLKNLVASGTGRLYILDLLVYYPGIDANSNAAQNFTSSAAASDQRPRSTTEKNTVMFFDVTTALGATPANMTVTYTDQSGNGSASSGAFALTTSSVVGRIPHATPFVPLAAGDTGARSVQTVQLSAAMGAGSALCLCMANVLDVIDVTTDQVPTRQLFATDPTALIEIPTGAALTYLWEPVSATASQRLISTLQFSECDLDAA